MVYSIASVILLGFIGLLALCGLRAHFGKNSNDTNDTHSINESKDTSDSNALNNNEDTSNLSIQGLMSAEEGAQSNDDLKRIKGIGPKLEALLHSLGIYTFSQISLWNDDDILKVDNRLQFSGRIKRDDWVIQAKEFSEETSV